MLVDIRFSKTALLGWKEAIANLMDYNNLTKQNNNYLRLEKKLHIVMIAMILDLS